MFPAEKKGEWEPLKVRERKVTKTVTTNGPSDQTDGDIAMGNADGENSELKTEEHEEEETLYEEDSTTEEGAVWPIQDGRVVDWSCFFALLTHVHNTLSPTLHTPVLVVTQPAWTLRDHETLTQFFFEKFKTPAFCIMDASLAACYAFATGTATVVDVGYTKCDVTAVNDFIITENGRTAGMTGCGGGAMTERLYSLLGNKGFSRDMCEQLKKSSICEVLPPGTELPGEPHTGSKVTNPAAAASTGVLGSGEGQRDSNAAQGFAPRGPGVDTDVGDEDQDREIRDGEADDGVLDVASIVASGKTNEFLARKEKEKQEKAAAKKAAGEVAAAAKQARLPNPKRLKATFQYTERRPPEDLNANGKRAADGEVGQNGDASKRQRTPELTTPISATAPTASESFDSAALARKEEKRRNRDAFIRRDIEVGVERLQAASGGILEDIADAIHRAVLAVPDYHKRSELWDSLIMIGNGSKVKGESASERQDHSSPPFIPRIRAQYLHTHALSGFKDALLATLNAKYLISPSSNTMFTSELPSTFTTPGPTGTNTPLPQPSSHHGPSGVNPLLLAATTSNLAPPGQSLHSQLQMQQHYQQQARLQQQQQVHVIEQPKHQQTPTSIGVKKMPEYFPEWKEVGTEEASFLGAQVAAKVVFVVDQGVSKGFMTRTEYNEMGPPGIHESCL